MQVHIQIVQSSLADIYIYASSENFLDKNSVVKTATRRTKMHHWPLMITLKVHSSLCCLIKKCPLEDRGWLNVQIGAECHHQMCSLRLFMVMVSNVFCCVLWTQNNSRLSIPWEDIRAMEQLQHHMLPNSFYTIITLVNMVECQFYELHMPILIFCWAGNVIRSSSKYTSYYIPLSS